jgi:8-amino-7-oxononanoate synthase
MSFLNLQMDSEMESIKRKNLFRSLRVQAGHDFSSNDYLGLSQNQILKEKMKEGIEIFGLGSTASRLIRGHREVYDELELKFANWVYSEDSLFLGSGFLANLGLIDALADSRTYILTDRLNHASLLDGIRISGAVKKYYNHNDLNHLEKILKTLPLQSNKILITESLFSMDGDFCNLSEILTLKEKYNFAIFLDEAHSIGVYGKQGSGYATETIQSKISLIDFRVYTAGKALGLEGAFVACTKQAKEFLINKMRTFIFSTAPMPAIAYTLLKSIELIKAMDKEREQIDSSSVLFKNRLSELGFKIGKSDSHIIPVLLKEEKFALMASLILQGDNFDIRAIRPPTVKESRLRISLNSNITEALVEEVSTSFKKVKNILIKEGFNFEE